MRTSIQAVTTIACGDLSAVDLRQVVRLWTEGYYCGRCEVYYPATALKDGGCPVHREVLAQQPAHLFEAARLTIKDAQPCEVLIDRTEGRAGVAWGGDATWIDLRKDETAEDAALIVLCQPDETERRR